MVGRGEMGSGYKILFGKPQGTGLLGRPGRRRYDAVMDLKVIMLEGVDWIHLMQDVEREWAF
jgi:hypothetical protein